MLKFLGSGSGFNTKLGNTSAYIKDNDVLFLIDCGSNIFERIQKYNILNDVKNVYVAITHLHPDHVGSLGDLIFYCYYVLKIKPNIIFPHNNLYNFLLTIGINGDLYNNYYQYDSIKIKEIDLYLYPKSTKHVEIYDDIYTKIFNHKNILCSNNFRCFGYIINYNKDEIYYSGDSNYIDYYSVINRLKEESFNKLSKLYQDTCKEDFEGNVHLSLKKLTELIPEELRHKVWCMHLDSDFDKNEAEELGFNVVENEFE